MLLRLAPGGALAAATLAASLGLAACGDSKSAPADARVPDAAPDAADPCLACAAGATCDATAATPCGCPAGFTGDGTAAGTGCADVDECASADANDCDELACANLAGSYQCEGLYAIEPFENVLARLDPATYALLDLSPLTAAETPTGTTAMAPHPTTGVLYAVVKSASGRSIGTIDPASATFTALAAVQNLSAITFGPGDTLYAVSGAGGNPPKTLYTLDTATGAATEVASIATGSDGAVICFNPDDDLMYYWVGSTGAMLSFSLADPATRTEISPSLGLGEIFGCQYLGGGQFLVHDISSRVRTVSTAGAVAEVPDAVASLFQDVRAVVRRPMAPHTARPRSGTSAGGTAVTLRGFGLTGATAVQFGGVAATSFTVVDDATIEAVAPAGTGTVDIAVTTASPYPATWRAAFAYIDP